MLNSNNLIRIFVPNGQSDPHDMALNTTKHAHLIAIPETFANDEDDDNNDDVQSEIHLTLVVVNELQILNVITFCVPKGNAKDDDVVTLWVNVEQMVPSEMPHRNKIN